MTVRKIFNIAFGLYVTYHLLKVFDIHLDDIILGDKQQLSSYITAIVGIVLIVGSLFFLFIDPSTKKIKSYNILTSAENVSNYMQLCCLLWFTKLDILHPFGTFFYLTVTLSLLLFCVWIIVKDAIKNRVLVSSVIIGHALLIFCMYSWSKNTYIQYYGDKIIGSFWEKPEYKTKYLVKLFNSHDSDQAYTLPAQIHVFSETFEYDDGDYYDTWTEKYIMLEAVYFSNGGYLTFDDCNLEVGNKVLCSDQDGTQWYIELTKEKIK